MASLLRVLVGPLFVLVILALGALSLFDDALAGGPVLETVLFVLDTRFLLWLAVGIFVVSFGLYLVALRREDPSALVHSGPTVEALVPVYGDADVLHQSVEALVGGAYADLTVTIITEPDDAASTDRAASLAATHDGVRVVVNHDHPGSKAGALNTGLAASEADVVAMFDADQAPDPQLVPHAVAALDDHSVARVRSIPRPTGGVLEAMVYYEYLLLFFLPQKLVRGLLGLKFAGTRSVLVERAVFDAVGEFTEGHLAEDLDFTHQLNQAGIDIRELLYYPCVEEPAHSVRDWWGQRVRWMSGQVAVSHGHLRDWRRLVDPTFVSSVLTLVGTLVAGVLLAMTVPKLVLSGLEHPLAVGGGLVAMFAVLLATRYVDNRTTGLDGYGVAWLLMPVTFTAFGLVIVQVLLQYAFGRVGGWYRVEKAADP